MAINNVKLINWKKHPHLELKLDGRNTFFVGDIAAGKSSVLDAIMMSSMQMDWPSDSPITEGQEAGMIEIERTINGEDYIIKRNFTNTDKGRWVVTYKTPKKGSRPPSLSDLLEEMLDKALKNSYFDYFTYFFKLKSAEARTEYIIEKCGGEEVAVNLKTITTKTNERRKVGSARTQQLAVYKQLGALTKEEVIEKSKLYAKEKTQEEADVAYNKIADTIEDGDKNIAELQEVRKQLQEKTKNNSRLVDIKLEIKKHQEAIELLTKENNELAVANKKNKSTVEKEQELETKRLKIVEDNTKIIIQAEAARKESITEIIKFNGERTNFYTSLTALKEYNRLDKEWQLINTEISVLENQNKELFISKLPIPELGLATKETEKETISIVTYKGREFSFENLSKGESIIIAAQIQNSLNPGGNNFIVIPEANLLGSKLDDILEECKKFQIQALVEITQRKQEFKVIFEEEFMRA